MIRVCIKYMLLICLVLFPLRLTFGQGLNASQDELKAVFLFNFTQFVEWPADAFTHRSAPFIIGVYGPDIFGKHLDEAVRNERVDGHPIRVLPVSSVAEISHCHMLFVNKSQLSEFYSLQLQLRGLTILTVSDGGDFCKSGGTIGFIQDKNKIRLQINMDAAADAGLKISSKLLRLAEIVSPKS